MVDYLKFDIEGFEWNVLEDIITHQSIKENVKQLGFEIHTKHLMQCYNHLKVGITLDIIYFKGPSVLPKMILAI